MADQLIGPGQCLGCGAAMSIEELQENPRLCMVCRAEEAAAKHPWPRTVPAVPVAVLYRPILRALVALAISAAVIALSALTLVAAWLIGGAPRLW